MGKSQNRLHFLTVPNDKKPLPRLFRFRKSIGAYGRTLSNPITWSTIRAPAIDVNGFFAGFFNR
jgi:hypothetical protein